MDDEKNCDVKSDPPTALAQLTDDATPKQHHDENITTLSVANGSTKQPPSEFVFYQPHEKLESRQDDPPDKILPHKFDILCGRDKVCHNHVGNHRFRVIIEMYRVAYQTAPSKDDKMRITKEIVTNVTSNGFRFLKKVGGSGENEVWAELDEAMARDKVSHALRGAKDPHQHQPRRKAKATNRRKNETDNAATTAAPPVAVDTPFPAPVGVPSNLATRRTSAQRVTMRRKRSASADSASSNSSSASDFTSSGTSASSAGAAKTPKLSNITKSQQPPPQPPFEVMLPPFEFMSMESIGQALQHQASLHIDDEPLPLNPLSQPRFDSLSRHQRFLEISSRQGEVLRDIRTDSFQRSSLEPLAAGRIPHSDNVTTPSEVTMERRSEEPMIASTATQQQPQSRQTARTSNNPSLVWPMGVTSDDDDEDEPPTIAELMNDPILREALLDSLRNQKLSDVALKVEDQNEDDDGGTPMLESIRSVETLMSSFSQQQNQQIDSIRSVDSIMSSFASKFSPARRNDLELTSFPEDQNYAWEPTADSVRSVDAIMSLVSKSTEPLPFCSDNHDALDDANFSHEATDSLRSVDMIMARFAKSSPAQKATEPLPMHRDETFHEDDDEEEPPTIADLVNDNMLCEALLSSLRLDGLRSQDEASTEKLPSS